MCEEVVNAHDRFNMERLSILDGDTELLYNKLNIIREYLADNLEPSRLTQ